MANIIIELSKYIIIIFMTIYTFECFSVFRYADEEHRNGIYIRQNVFMFLIHFISFIALCLEMKDGKLILFYAIQQITIFGVIVLYRVIYPNANRLIVNNMCMLLTIGFIILTRLSFSKAEKQFIIAVFSLAATMLIPYIIKKFRHFERFSWLYAIIGIAALGIVMLFSSVVNGSKLNFTIANYTFQPSEFVKIIFVFAIAGILCKSTDFKNVVISAVIAGIHVIILVLSKDLGSAVIFFVVYFAILYVATKNLGYYLLSFACGAGAAVIGYQLFSHVRVRVAAWRDPLGTIEDAGFQISQSLFAIGTGSWFGMGLGQGAPNKIPVVEADFIFSAITEEFGVIFGLCLILICVSCFVMFMNISMRFNNRFYKLVAVGLAVVYGFQVFLTIGGVTKFIPLTGVTLPLVSYGGTSIIVSLIMFAIIQGLYIAVRDDTVTNKRKKTEKNDKREIGYLTYMFVALFISLIGYLMYFTQFKSTEFINNSYNTRQDLLAQKVVRGSILSRNRETLAATVVQPDGSETRNYPYQNLFAHAVGYSTHGKTGVESISNFTLLTSNDFIGDRLKNDIEQVKNQGDNVVTTLDVNLQRTASDAVGVYKGAVVVMNVKTGEILALVSKPDFDPNQVNAIWDEVNEDSENSVLLNRATQGIYPPGSTFKIVTALEYLKENADASAYSFDCTGSFHYEDLTINCYHGQKHGMVDFKTSFAKSCNSSFANISTGLDKKAFQKTCKELLFNGELPIPYTYRESYVPISAASDMDEVMQTGIGQGKTQITPMHMTLITSAIANNGVLMKPYVISAVENANKDIVKTYEAEEYKKLMTEENAKQLQELMAEVVQSGTATKVKDTVGYVAAGKTGSAEYNSDKSQSHAWFTGFAPVNNPEIAVTVVLEGAGSGGEYAVPIAKRIFDAYFN